MWGSFLLRNTDASYGLGLAAGAALLAASGALARSDEVVRLNDFAGFWAGARLLVQGVDPYDGSVFRAEVAALAATACTVPAVERPSVPAVEQPAAAHDELILSAERSTLVFDPTNGATLRTLPAGVLSPARDAIVSVSPDAATCGGRRDVKPCTAVAAYDLQGTLLDEWSLDGSYVLPATYGPARSGFSPNGNGSFSSTATQR